MARSHNGVRDKLFLILWIRRLWLRQAKNLLGASQPEVQSWIPGFSDSGAWHH